MGGAVGCRVSERLEAEANIKIAAVAIMDVSEEMGLLAMPGSKQFVASFPKSFGSYEDAINWAVPRIVKSRESAAISLPSQLKEESDHLYVT